MIVPTTIRLASSTKKEALNALPIITEKSYELETYSASLAYPDLWCRIIKNGMLLGRDLVICNQFYYPIRELWPAYRKTSLIGYCREVVGLWRQKPATPTSLPGAICSLASHPCWENNIFHWFLDILPRLLASEVAFGNSDSFSLVKPGSISQWQRDSLHMLGYDCHKLVILPNTSRLAIKADLLLGLVEHRNASLAGLPPYPIFPYFVKALKRRFSHVESSGCAASTTRIIIIRRRSEGRSFCNLSDIQSFAEHHGFCLIDLTLLSLADQISIFRNSSHIIAAHGAGLTHLIHCSQAAVLEIHCSDHGIRPDYLQIAAINNLRYFYHVCPAINDQADMLLDIRVFESFIRQTSD